MAWRAFARGYRPHSPRLRQLGVCLTALGLLLGSLVWHTGLEQHGALDGPTRIFLTPHGPGAHERVEAAQSVELPSCPACVLQLQTVGSVAPSPFVPVGFVRLGVATVTDVQPPAFASPRLDPSRGPPLG